MVISGTPEEHDALADFTLSGGSKRALLQWFYSGNC